MKQTLILSLSMLVLAGVGPSATVSSVPSQEAAVQSPAVQRPTGEYIASSLVRIGYREPRLLTQGKAVTADEHHEFETFCRTQITMVRSRYFLTRALHNTSAAAKVDLVTKQDDPLQWLASALELSFPDDAEFFQISLRGDNPDELKVIVDAVTVTYLEEVTNNERNILLSRIARLERAKQSMQERYRTRRRQLQTLSETLGIADSSQLELRQRIAIDHVAHMKRELTRVNLELTKVQVEQSVQEKAAATALPESVIADKVNEDSSITELREQVERLQQTNESLPSRITDNRHPAILNTERRLEDAKKALESRREKVRLAVLENRRMAAEENLPAVRGQFDQTVAVLSAQRDFLQKELDAELNEIANPVKTPREAEIDVQFLRDETAQIQKTMGELRAEIALLNLEVAGPSSRVSEFEPALVSRVKHEK